MYKDACNRKSNQQNLGTIKSSNLCTEIVEYTSPKETAVCNLASISLKKFVKKKDCNGLVFRVFSKPNCVYCELAKGLLNKMNIQYETKDYKELTGLSGLHPHGVKFPQIYRIDNHKTDIIGGYTELYEYLKPSYDFIGLQKIAERLTKNLNNIIDNNYYPTPETKTSNLRHRPIGIGVQGLANVFFEFGYAFDSDEAKELNERIFECIYYGSLKASMELSKCRENDMIKYKSYKNQFADGSDFGGDNFISSDEFNKIKNLLKNVIPEELNRDEYLGSYSSFIGSPLYNGKLQFDL